MKSKPSACFLSLIVPSYNESGNIGPFFGEVVPLLESLDITYEIICIDDGSTDNTLEALKAIRQENSHVRIVQFSRNFGKEAAITAGLEYSIGQVVIPIDADLQHPVSLIPDMIAKWEEGYKVVTTTIERRVHESFIKRVFTRTFYKLINHYSDVPIPKNTGDFRLVDRQVVDAILQLPERNRFMKGIFAWVGFKRTTLYFKPAKRYSGSTKWSFLKLWSFALDGICSLTSFPLKVWTYLGACVAAVTFFYAVIIIAKTAISGVDVPGYASLIVAVLFFGSIQLISLGIIGEYVSRIYDESKNRPLYVVEDLHESDEK